MIAGWLCFWLSYSETKSKTHRNPMTHFHSDEGRTSASDDSRLNTLLSALSHSPQTGKSRIRLIAIGAPEDLVQLIHRLHRCGLEVPQWSTPQPIPETNEVVRVYIQTGGRSGDRL
jgi:hypothetical protein